MQAFEALLQAFLKLLQGFSVHASRALVAPHFLPS
jgi:hypothetical protein